MDMNVRNRDRSLALAACANPRGGVVVVVVVIVALVVTLGIGDSLAGAGTRGRGRRGLMMMRVVGLSVVHRSGPSSPSRERRSGQLSLAGWLGRHARARAHDAPRPRAGFTLSCPVSRGGTEAPFAIAAARQSRAEQSTATQRKAEPQAGCRDGELKAEHRCVVPRSVDTPGGRATKAPTITAAISQQTIYRHNN